MEAFKTSRDHIAHGTMRNDRRVLRNLLDIAKAAGVETVDEVDIELLDAYHAKRKICPLTWTKELTTLRQFLDFCRKRKWIRENPAEEIKPPKVKPKPKEPYTGIEVSRILAACDELGRGSYERLRARAAVLVLRYTGLRIIDVATLARDRVKGGKVVLYTQKNGKPVNFDIPPVLCGALATLPTPKGTLGQSKFFFWSGNGTKRALVRGLTRSLARVFEISGVEGAHAHRFRHTLATGLLARGRTLDQVAIVLGSSPAIIGKHYAQWTTQRQEQISSLAQDVWDDEILSGTEKKPVSSEEQELLLVDGMGFEPTTPTLRTWCSPS
jgi:site-specific recombinase XerD